MPNRQLLIVRIQPPCKSHYFQYSVGRKKGNQVLLKGRCSVCPQTHDKWIDKDHPMIGHWVRRP